MHRKERTLCQANNLFPLKILPKRRLYAKVQSQSQKKKRDYCSPLILLKELTQQTNIRWLLLIGNDFPYVFLHVFLHWFCFKYFRNVSLYNWVTLEIDNYDHSWKAWPSYPSVWPTVNQNLMLPFFIHKSTKCIPLFKRHLEWVLWSITYIHLQNLTINRVTFLKSLSQYQPDSCWRLNVVLPTSENHPRVAVSDHLGLASERSLPMFLAQGLKANPTLHTGLPVQILKVKWSTYIHYVLYTYTQATAQSIT